MKPNTPHDTIEQNIDRALAGLRDAQPRSGLNGRILASLEHRTAAARPHLSVHVALWCATSAAILAVASFAIVHHSTQENVRVAHSLSQARGWGRDASAGTNAADAKPLLAMNLARTSTEPTRRMAHRSPMPATCSESGCPIHDGGTAAVMSGAAQDPDAQALADLHAPSHPAPPLPLTPQEKLFLRMMQYGNATQLAELDPVVRAKENADETTAFKAFFPDPPPLKQPGDDE